MADYQSLNYSTIHYVVSIISSVNTDPAALCELYYKRIKTGNKKVLEIKTSSIHSITLKKCLESSCGSRVGVPGGWGAVLRRTTLVAKHVN